jgi:hypothetical protein
LQAKNGGVSGFKPDRDPEPDQPYLGVDKQQSSLIIGYEHVMSMNK